MKKMIIGIVALVIALSFTGCSEAKTSSEADDTRIENSKTSSDNESVLASSSQEDASKNNEQQTDNSKVIASGDCGENGDNVMWKLHEDGLLVIEGSGKMKDYPIDEKNIWADSNNDVYTTPWRNYNDKIKSVAVLEGVTYIGEGTFYGFKLNSLILPDSLETLRLFGFMRERIYLSSLRIPKGIKKIGGEFIDLYNIENLETIEVDEENEYFSSVDGVLYNKDKTILLSCPPKKSEVVIPYGVKTIGAYAFRECTEISTIELPVTVKSIEPYAFSWCTELSNVSIPEGLTSIGDEAFAVSTKITSIYIPNSVTKIGGDAFSDHGGPMETTDHERITISCYAGSAAEKYAKKYRLKYELID